MAKIYQGESLTLAFRCKYSCGRPADLAGMDISAILRDSYGDAVYSFSTNGLPGTKPIRVDKNYVVCFLSSDEMADVVGSYVVEVKVKKSDLVMIAISKKIKVYPSVIGENVNL